LLYKLKILFFFRLEICGSNKAGYKACLVSESAAMRIMVLPLHSELQKEAINKIAEIILVTIK
jgi:hypothetical protein